MKKAIILYGPSGCGKTTLAKKIVKKFNYKHCDTDYFMFTFSKERSKERSEIAVEVNYTYIKELIKRKHDLVIEAMPTKKINSLKRILKKERYKIFEVSLISTIEKCLTNNKTRSERRYTNKTIKEVFEKYTEKKGFVIDTTNLSENQVFNLVKKELE